MAAWCLNSSIAGQVAATLISSQVHMCSEGNLFVVVVVVVNPIVGLLTKSDLSFVSLTFQIYYYILIRLRINDTYIWSPPNIVAFSVRLYYKLR